MRQRCRIRDSVHWHAAPRPERMLGRFLEISVRVSDILESLAFYESLGFVQAAVGDTRPYPYAVVTDGRLILGLHAAPVDSPCLTWTHPDLKSHAPKLQSLGIEFARAEFGDDAFHELAFWDPAGQMVTILEARTYSPPSAGDVRQSSLGYFEEYG